jgi:hypothetical protein
MTKTKNSKQTATSYYRSGYGSIAVKSSRKNKKLKDCSTD